MTNTRFPVFLLSALLAVQSIGGIGGGLALTLSPSGAFMQMPVSFLEGSPFGSFLVPGLILLLLLGILPGVLAYAVIRKPEWKGAGVLNIYPAVHWSWTYSLYTGIMLSVWIFIEQLWIRYDLLQTIFGLTGILIMVVALIPANMKYAGWKP